MYLPLSLSLACPLLLLFHCPEILLRISPWKQCNKMYLILLICLTKILHWFDEHWHIVQCLSQGVFAAHKVFVTWVLSWASVWPWTEKCQNKPFTRHHLPSWLHLRWSADQTIRIKWSMNRRTVSVLPAHGQIPSALGSRQIWEKGRGKKEKRRQKEKKYRWTDLPSQGQKLLRDWD